MRPASDVLLDIIVEMDTYPDPEYDCLPRNPVAIIEADRKQVREAAFREVVDTLVAMRTVVAEKGDRQGTIWLVKARREIERKFLGEKA